MNDLFALFLIVVCIVAAPVAGLVLWERNGEPDSVCHTPQLVAKTPDGISLYAINYPSGCRDRIVYFSSCGTHTYHMEGKMMIEDNISNAK